MKFKYIHPKPFRTPTHKFITGEIYELDQSVIEPIASRFEAVTENKKKAEVTNVSSEQQ